MKWLLFPCLLLVSLHCHAQIQWVEIEAPSNLAVCKQLLPLGEGMLLANTSEGVFLSDKSTIAWKPLMKDGSHISTKGALYSSAIRLIPGKNDSIFVVIPSDELDMFVYAFNERTKDLTFHRSDFCGFITSTARTSTGDIYLSGHAVYWKFGDILWAESLPLIRSTDNLKTQYLFEDAGTSHKDMFVDENDRLYALQGFIVTVDPTTKQSAILKKEFKQDVYAQNMHYHSGNIFVQVDSQIYISPDKGITWDLTSEKKFRFIIKMLFDSFNNIYVIESEEVSQQSDGMVWKSSDYGTSWTEVSGTLHGSDWYTSFIDDNDFLYVATSAGMYRSLHPVTGNESPEGASRFVLSPAYPNPVAAGMSATVSYRLESPGETTLALYNILGRRVRSISLGHQTTGTHSYILSTSDLVPGIYQYFLHNASGNSTGKLIIR